MNTFTLFILFMVVCVAASYVCFTRHWARNKDGKRCWGRWKEKEGEKDLWETDARECLRCGQYQTYVFGWSDFGKPKEQGHKSEEHAKESVQETKPE